MLGRQRTVGRTFPAEGTAWARARGWRPAVGWGPAGSGPLWAQPCAERCWGNTLVQAPALPRGAPRQGLAAKVSGRGNASCCLLSPLCTLHTLPELRRVLPAGRARAGLELRPPPVPGRLELMSRGSGDGGPGFESQILYLAVVGPWTHRAFL